MPFSYQKKKKIVETNYLIKKERSENRMMVHTQNFAHSGCFLCE